MPKRRQAPITLIYSGKQRGGREGTKKLLNAQNIMLLLPSTLINKRFSLKHMKFHACASILKPLTNWLPLLLVVYLVNPLRPRYPSPDYPLSIQRKWLPKMKMHTSHSNLQFIVTSPSLFALKLSINLAYVSNYSPDIFNLEQRNTVSRKKILFTAITVIFQQVYM